MRKVGILAVVVALAVMAGCTAVPGPAAPGSQAGGVQWPGGSSAVASSGPEPFDASQLDPRVTQATIRSTIAVNGYTARVRPAESVTQPIKSSLMRLHHYTDAASAYELDHFIPLELGGSSNLSNLWLEPIAEARTKDADEKRAHDRVVAGAWTLARGQQYIRDRWRIHYADTASAASLTSLQEDAVSGIMLAGNVSDASPTQKTAVTVAATVTDASGGLVEGARVGFIWHFKTVTRTDWADTDASGVARDTRQIGRATKGYRVNVDLVVDAPGSSTGSAWFVPR